MNDEPGAPYLKISARGMRLSAAERAAAESMFWFTLGKFEPGLRRVGIEIGRAEGQPGRWLECRVSALVHGGTPILVEGSDRDLAACVGRTLRRAEREMHRRSRGVGRGSRVPVRGTA